MRRLAEKLGIKAASLYNHVKDKDELLALMANAICAEIPDLDHSKPWREQAERMALQVRTVLMAHRDGARVLAATLPVGPIVSVLSSNCYTRCSAQDFRAPGSSTPRSS